MKKQGKTDELLKYSTKLSFASMGLTLLFIFFLQGWIFNVYAIGPYIDKIILFFIGVLLVLVKIRLAAVKKQQEKVIEENLDETKMKREIEIEMQSEGK